MLILKVYLTCILAKQDSDMTSLWHYTYNIPLILDIYMTEVRYE